jgi:omega-6 fatty acid desaturase (delta-12 desaturase)
VRYGRGNWQGAGYQFPAETPDALCESGIVQHQFEGVSWSRKGEWDPVKAALEGSSYYKLPKALQWISGNIGLHPVHHLLPMIPNYNLQAAFDTSPVMKTVKVLTLGKSLRSFSLNLWDEKQKKLVSFRSLKEPASG